jgi:hypothetical protein
MVYVCGKLDNRGDHLGLGATIRLQLLEEHKVYKFIYARLLRHGNGWCGGESTDQ